MVDNELMAMNGHTHASLCLLKEFSKPERRPFLKQMAMGMVHRLERRRALPVAARSLFLFSVKLGVVDESNSIKQRSPLLSALCGECFK